MLTRLKERIQQLMVDEARLAHKVGLTPNQISFLGVLAALFSAYLYWTSRSDDAVLIAAAVLLLISGFFDALDGVLARTYGRITLFGGFLDSLLDRYADSMVLVGVTLGWLATEPSWLLIGLAALMGTLLVSYSRARAEAAGVKMETVGLAERAERIMIIVAASFLTLLWRDALHWSMFFLAVLTNLTVLHRTIYFRRKAREKESATTTVV
ncbi:MAG TPA: CDP-alcohol phosphatidyltransferase family protein [Candidatus Bathyarchaeia archaeon]|nr:CDP-alcohol phosphatidyltransferase family protein [Candidatus Bathyarchaeia archaeon]